MNAAKKTAPYLTITKRALQTIFDQVDGTDVAYCCAVYVALRWAANDARSAEGPFSATVAQIAARSGLSYNSTVKVLGILKSIGLLAVESQRIAGTKARAPSVYTFPTIRGTPSPQRDGPLALDMGNTFPTATPPRRAEIIQKEWKEQKEPQKSRARDLVFDVLATVDGSDLAQLTNRAKRTVGVALAEIRAVEPDVTPEEIGRRAAQYRRIHPLWTLTASALAKHWASLGTARKPDVSLSEPEGWRDQLREAFGADCTLLADERPFADKSQQTQQAIIDALATAPHAH